MKTYDVFIRDAEEYGGGFEIRLTANDADEAKAEAIAMANDDDSSGTVYVIDDAVSVSEYRPPSADDMATSDGLGLQ